MWDPPGDDALRIAVIRRTLPHGYDKDLNLCVPRDGPGGLPPFLNVRAERHGPGGRLPGRVVWFGAANGAAQEEERGPRHSADAADVTGVRRNL